jgi:hypothetical protein
MAMSCMVLIIMLTDLAKFAKGFLQIEASYVLSICEDPNTGSVSLPYVSILIFKVGHV